MTSSPAHEEQTRTHGSTGVCVNSLLLLGRNCELQRLFEGHPPEQGVPETIDMWHDEPTPLRHLLSQGLAATICVRAM